MIDRLGGGPERGCFAWGSGAVRHAVGEGRKGGAALWGCEGGAEQGRMLALCVRLGCCFRGFALGVDLVRSDQGANGTHLAEGAGAGIVNDSL